MKSVYKSLLVRMKIEGYCYLQHIGYNNIFGSGRSGVKVRRECDREVTKRENHLRNQENKECLLKSEGL